MIEFSQLPGWTNTGFGSADPAWPAWVPGIGSADFLAWIGKTVPKPLPAKALPVTGFPIAPNWTSMPTDLPKPPSDEISLLVTAAAEERADAMGEIMSQADEFSSYFMNLVTARPGSHPATAALLIIASQIGTFIAMCFKQAYQRPRPSQLCPALLPPLEVPGHASFPSGHSTQAHLMALCLDAALTPLTAAGAPGIPNDTQTTVIWALADRIARNREIAGLHYPSDSDAGVALANSVFGLLKVLDKSTVFGAAMNKAQAEWQ